MARHPSLPATELSAALPAGLAILVTGGTGFVGRRLVEALAQGGHRVIVLSRNPDAAQGLPRKVRLVGSLDQIGPGEQIDAVVNLAGEPIANGLWTRAKRQRIIESRRAVTRECVALMARLDRKPAAFISASAVGWYGLHGDEELDEQSSGNACFSREVCVMAETEAARAEALGVRTVRLRIGLVIDAGGGLLQRMVLPFKLGLGGPFGRGRHWMSWIHRDDLVRLICHAIATPDLSGPVNATAPEPVRNSDFTRALGGTLNRPAVIPVPAAPLRWVAGDLAKELLLGGQRVLPVAALRSGFSFVYPALPGALKAIFRKV
ncbi:MAG: TIGR01777 family oxidoreductase [Novosphingobium sp.]